MKKFKQLMSEDIKDSKIIASSWKLVKILVDNISADLNEIIALRQFETSEKNALTKEMVSLQQRLNILEKKVRKIKEKARNFK
jgi:polyhydroxyalkanoate synthesis regulator phasin